MHVKVDYPNSAAERDILKLARREASTGEQVDQPEFPRLSFSPRVKRY